MLQPRLHILRYWANAEGLAAVRVHREKCKERPKSRKLMWTRLSIHRKELIMEELPLFCERSPFMKSQRHWTSLHQLVCADLLVRKNIPQLSSKQKHLCLDYRTSFTAMVCECEPHSTIISEQAKNWDGKTGTEKKYSYRRIGWRSFRRSCLGYLWLIKWVTRGSYIASQQRDCMRYLKNESALSDQAAQRSRRPRDRIVSARLESTRSVWCSSERTQDRTRLTDSLVKPNCPLGYFGAALALSGRTSALYGSDELSTK